MDYKLIKAGVDIKITLDKCRPNSKRYWPLLRDLVRIKNQMTQEEMRIYTERA